MPFLDGTVLEGRYRLLRRVGAGGMGTVYEAEHLRLDKKVAVKVLRDELAAQSMARKRFVLEANSASRICHPHVINISDYGETPEGLAFFVMELLEGRDLQQELDVVGCMTWERARRILLQITSALELVHQSGIVHRDMKPSNCFLLDVPGGGEGIEGDFVKVLDFGIAKVMKPIDDDKLTSTAALIGTFSYLAPEVIQDTIYSPQSDVYAVGVMMYRMLVGRLPFRGANVHELLMQHINDAPPPPRARQPSIPPEVEAIILKALDKSYDDRFSSMSALREAIRRVPPGSTTGGPSSPSARASVEAESPADRATRLDASPTGRQDPAPTSSQEVARSRRNASLPAPSLNSAASGRSAKTSALSFATTLPPSYSSRGIVEHECTPVGDAGLPAPAVFGSRLHTRRDTAVWLASMAVLASLGTAVSRCPMPSRTDTNPISLDRPAPVREQKPPSRMGFLPHDVHTPDSVKTPTQPVEPTTEDLRPLHGNGDSGTQVQLPNPPNPRENVDVDTPNADGWEDDEENATVSSSEDDHDRRKKTSDDKSTKPPKKRKSKKTPAEISSLTRKIIRRCWRPGQPNMRVDFFVSQRGKVIGLRIDPTTDADSCAMSIIKKTRFKQPYREQSMTFTVRNPR